MERCEERTTMATVECPQLCLVIVSVALFGCRTHVDKDTSQPVFDSGDTGRHDSGDTGARDTATGDTGQPCEQVEALEMQTASYQRDEDAGLWSYQAELVGVPASLTLDIHQDQVGMAWMEQHELLLQDQDDPCEDWSVWGISLQKVEVDVDQVAGETTLYEMNDAYVDTMSWMFSARDADGQQIACWAGGQEPDVFGADCVEVVIQAAR